MLKFLILHGTGATPKSNWFMWLKGALIGQGHSVWLPQLPDADRPNTETYNKFLLSNKDFTFDEDTVIVGHSSGAVEALNLLQHLPDGVTIKATVLISAFRDDLGRNDLKGLFAEEFDFERIKKTCSNITYIHSDDDPYCPVEGAEYLAMHTNGDMLLSEGQGHFNTELSPHYKQFPELLDILDDVVN